MPLKEYLASLSKEDLISLLMQLADNQREVKDFLLQKMSKIQQQKKVRESALQEQSVVLDNQRLVSRKSTPQEKINLYKSLFVGRQDVFALRWYNTKSGRSGYSPVCANKWVVGKCDLKKYSCATCPYKSPVKLDDSYIFNHLAGRDEFCRDVIGVYPLMDGNVCRFLAMDFDAHAPKEQTSIVSTHANDAKTAYAHKNEGNFWKDDILAVHKTCTDFGVSSYIEISRSGNGGHLWIFFSENVSASIARNLGSGIIKASMQNRHSISFATFDRMFPNQDEVPKGGYGNLIALPLQGRAVKQGYSVFVDENFMPYDDQWEFLTRIQKVDERTVRKIITEIENQIPNFVEKDGSENEKISKSISKADVKDLLAKEDFPQKIKIKLTNYVEIEKSGISEKTLGVFRRTAVFLNPEYFKNLRMHLPLYNIPRFIDCSKENEKSLLLPRGNLNQVLEKIENANAEYEITDNRETGTKINATFSEKLYDEQREALNAMFKSETGILSAGTGFGKTVVAMALIAERKTNTLILVQSHALLEQWKKSVKKFLNIDTGTIAAGKDKSTGIIDVAIVNSLTEKKSDEVKPRTQKYGMLIVDECHHVSAFTTENLVASFKVKYVYGLTATPIRRDGHQKIIFYQCGQILYSTTAKQMNQSQNFAHYLVPRFSSFHYVQINSDSENPKINEYYEKLVSNEARNNLIIEDVKNAVLESRTPLILSDRIEHLKTLKERLVDCAKNVILITGRGTQKQKKEQLEKLNSVQTDESLIILSTGKYAGEGFDFPRIDTLMLVMPFSWKGTLAQYCGRLHRNFKGKDDVRIYDYVDFRISIFDRMYQNRLKGYKQLGYTIKSETCSENIKENDVVSKLFSMQDYRPIFEKDIVGTKNRIIITAPYLSISETQTFTLLASKLLTNGVGIQIFVRKPDDEWKFKKLQTCLNLLENAGITVIQKENVSQKIAIIDEKVLWYGNINFLGYSETEECAMRIVNLAIASEIEGEILQSKIFP